MINCYVNAFLFSQALEVWVVNTPKISKFKS